MADPLYSSEYNDAAADVLRRFLVPALAAAGPLDAHAGRVGAGAVQGPPDGQGRAGDGRPRRRAAHPGPLVRPRARRRPRPGAVRRLGRDHGQHPGAARRGRRLPRRGLRPDQAQDRARLGRRAGARGPRAVRRRRAAPGRREHGVHARRRPPPRQARPVRPAADRAAARGGGRARPRRPREADPDAGLPRRVDRVGAVRGGRDPARRGRDRQHQARSGRRLPRGAQDPRRVRRERRPGLVRRHARDRPRPRGQRRARRAAGLHAAGGHLGLGALLPRATSPSRSCSTTATSTSRPAPVSACSRSRTGSTRSPPRPSGSRSDRLYGARMRAPNWLARRSRLAPYPPTVGACCPP